MLIGVLGGPVGVLLDWGAGAMMGGVFDVDRAVTSDEALTVLGQAIPPGATPVIASVEEAAVEVIDGEMKKLDCEVTRRPVTEVMASSRRRRTPPTPPRPKRGHNPRRAQGPAERGCQRARWEAEREAPRLLIDARVPVVIEAR